MKLLYQERGPDGYAVVLKELKRTSWPRTCGAKASRPRAVGRPFTAYRERTATQPRAGRSIKNRVTGTAFTRMTKTKLLLLVALVYLTVIVLLDFLQFAPRGDELHFWPTALSFSESWVPSLDQLRAYHELTTPLSFLIFGALEHLLHGGIAAGRLFNMGLSFGMTAVIITATEDTRRGALAAAGLLIFPYYLAVSAHLYPDVIGAAFVLAALMCHFKRRPFASAACWCLAIASRQYAVAFPLAVAAYELFRGGQRPSNAKWRWLGPLASAATIGGWMWLFGGPAPAGELAVQGIEANRLRHLDPTHAVYLLVCVGVYYVVPEILLFRRQVRLKPDTTYGMYGVVLATVLASLAFPPLGNDWGTPTMGLFDRMMVSVLTPWPRTIVYAGLAALAALRFSENSPAAFLVAANAGILLISHTMWEKYALALLVCLWYLRAADPAGYFQPLGFRVNRAGNAGLLSGTGSGSPDASLISCSSSASLGRPASWSTNIRECCDGISNFFPHVLQVTSSSRRSR